MNATVVRYQTKPERAGENARLIEGVFADLAARDAKGFTYMVFRQADDVSFVHVVIEDDTATDPDSLQDVPAFKRFVENIADRCDVAPVATSASIVGCWR